MDLSHWTTRCEDVTFVSLLVENPHTEAARFRMENRLDGPVWPPRRNGRPEQGWDRDGYEGRVEADGDLVLGYATPAPPEEPVATIEWAEPEAGSSGQPALERAARTYADPRPPRDVVSPVAAAGTQPAIDGIGTMNDMMPGEDAGGTGGGTETSESGGSA